MSTKTLSFADFTDLIKSESKKGIINGGAFMQMIMDNKMPKIIRDIRGSVRLSIERSENGLEVTKYTTDLAMEKIGEIY